jgi:Skp family chaperone for outer membrane proteins
MEKLIDREQTFLKEIETAVDNLLEQMENIESMEAIDDAGKEFLKEEGKKLGESLKELHQDHRRFYNLVRQSMIFDRLP